MMNKLATIFENPESASCPGSDCCGNALKADGELLDLLLKLVEKTGVKLYLKYFYKCIAFNRDIGGGNDYHAQGLAVDIDTIKTGIDPGELAQIAWETGFNAVGVYGTNDQPGYKGKIGMVHLGLEPSRRYWGDWEPDNTGRGG